MGVIIASYLEHWLLLKGGRPHEADDKMHTLTGSLEQVVAVQDF